MFEDHASICDLLFQADLLDRKQAGSLMLECAKSGVTAGQWLVESGAMPAGLVRAAVLSMVLGRNHLLPTAIAIRGIKLMASENLSFEEALSRCGFRRDYFRHVRLVTALLTESDNISKQDCAVVYELCMSRELPLVEILVRRQVISQLIGDSVLLVERLVLSDALAFGQGVEVLKNVRHYTWTVEEALQNMGRRERSTQQVKLGELLLSAQALTPFQLLSAVEVSLYNHMLLGDALVAAGVADKFVIAAALNIQKDVNAGKVAADEGVAQLRNLALMRQAQQRKVEGKR